MKKALLLFAALLVAGCGEKSSSEGSESANESAEPSGDTANALSDTDVERLLKEAVDLDSVGEWDDEGRFYLSNESEPYSGWVKEMYDSGQVKTLGQSKDGRENGLGTAWHENGQKMAEGTIKDRNPEGRPDV
jgi:hypothetical protein